MINGGAAAPIISRGCRGRSVTFGLASKAAMKGSGLLVREPRPWYTRRFFAQNMAETKMII